MSEVSLNKMNIDYTKTKCPNPKCRDRQGKLVIIAKVGPKCFRFQCLSCSIFHKRKIPIITEWVDEIKRTPNYLMEKLKGDAPENDIEGDITS